MLLIYTAIHLTPVQNWLVKQAANTLSKKMKTKVLVKHVDFDFFNKLQVQGILIEDLKKDTLLSAGEITINITDWFFFKDKPVLQYAKLQDVIVNLNRTDSIWNYAFIEDFFASPKPDTPTKKQSGNFELDLKKIELINIQFNQKDSWIGQDQIIKLGKMSLEADNFDLVKKKIDLTTIHISEPVFFQNDYTGNREKLNIPRKPRKILTTIPQYKWNNDGWIIAVKEMMVSNGSLQVERETKRAPYTDQFDGDHFIFANISGTLKNLLFEKDTLRSHINLGTKEKCGFEINKLDADLKFTPNEMEFANLEIRTPHSKLSDYYAMRYNDFQNDMGRFLHNVVLDGNFKNSTISSIDIAYFAPELKTWNRKININGTAKGTIDNLTAKNVSLQSNNTFITGSITMIGLPDINKTFIDFRTSDMRTSFTEISSIIPSLKDIKIPDIQKLGNIQFKGNYTGFLTDFVVNGNLNSSIGDISGDINLKLPFNAPMAYTGKISSNHFNLGELVGDKNIGKLSFNANVNGVGASTDDLNAKITGQIKGIEYNKYNFQNITINGNFKNKLFNGVIDINDPNLVVENLTGEINLQNKEPQFKFDAILSKLSTNPLKLTSDDYSVTGHFNLDFTGNNIDNFLGSAKVFNARILHRGKPLSFDSLTLESKIIDNNKSLQLRSNEADVSINGRFNIMELPNAFQLFLNKYYPSYIPKISKKLNNQDFTFSIKTKNIEEYVPLVNRKLSGFNYSVIEGNLNLQKNELNINASIPSFNHEKKVFTNITVEGKGNLDSLVTKINADDISINDSIHLPSTRLVIQAHNDSSNISINTSANQTLGDASLNAMVKTMKNGAKIHFFPSSFIVNDKKWQIEKDGELTFLNDQIFANEIKIVQGNQSIGVYTEPSEIFNSNDIVVNLKNINLEEVTPFLFKTPHLEGLASGKILIENGFSKPLIDFDLSTEKFKLDKDSIGVINTKGTFSTTTGIAKFNANSKGEKNNFDISGYFNSKDSTENQTNISFNTKRFNLGILNSYLGDIFEDIKGDVSTDDLKITGHSKNLSLTGNAIINDASLIVKYTQCKYTFTNEDISFKPDEIDFNSVRLKDTLNNTAVLTGKIRHTFFDNFSFDKLHFETPKLLVLNTTKKDNNQFYGKVIGKAKLDINGPAEKIAMEISGEPSTTDTSQIYILGGSSVESDEIDYINFVQFGREMDKINAGKVSSSVLLNMYLTANPSCKIDVVLDEVTGDVIKGVGNGLLHITVGNKEPLSIRGRYDITKGEYTFNFQTFLKKPFTLNSGNIVWSGDPFLANIDIIAEYLAKNVDFTNISTDLRKKSDVRIVSHLTETLLKPKISFVFQLPDNSDIKNDFVISKKLQEFTYDENEMNKQVTSLLLFNTFINNNQGFLNAGSGYSVLSNTIGGVISGALSNSFNKILQKILNDNTVSFNVDLNSNLDMQSNVARLQGAAKASITKAFFDSRVVLTVGGNFDYNNPYVLNTGRNNSVLITPDVTAEWFLTKDGRVRIVGFNQTNTDLIGQRNRTGIKLIYRKEVDNLSNIFKR